MSMGGNSFKINQLIDLYTRQYMFKIVPTTTRPKASASTPDQAQSAALHQIFLIMVRRRKGR